MADKKLVTFDQLQAYDSAVRVYVSDSIDAAFDNMVREPMTFKVNGIDVVSFNGEETKSINLKGGNHVSVTSDADTPSDITVDVTDDVLTDADRIGEDELIALLAELDN